MYFLYGLYAYTIRHISLIRLIRLYRGNCHATTAIILESECVVYFWKVSARCISAVQSYYIKDVSGGARTFQKLFSWSNYYLCLVHVSRDVSEAFPLHAAKQSYYVQDFRDAFALPAIPSMYLEMFQKLFHCMLLSRSFLHRSDTQTLVFVAKINPIPKPFLLVSAQVLSSSNTNCV